MKKQAVLDDQLINEYYELLNGEGYYLSDFYRSEEIDHKYIESLIRRFKDKKIDLLAARTRSESIFSLCNLSTYNNYYLRMSLSIPEDKIEECFSKIFKTIKDNNIRYNIKCFTRRNKNNFNIDLVDIEQVKLLLREFKANGLSKKLDRPYDISTVINNISVSIASKKNIRDESYYNCQYYKHKNLISKYVCDLYECFNMAPSTHVFHTEFYTYIRRYLDYCISQPKQLDNELAIECENILIGETNNLNKLFSLYEELRKNNCLSSEYVENEKKELKKREGILKNSIISTAEKYNTDQAYLGIFNVLNFGNYNYFSNDNEERKNLINKLSPSEICVLIQDSFGNNNCIDDEMIYTYINSMLLSNNVSKLFKGKKKIKL